MDRAVSASSSPPRRLKGLRIVSSLTLVSRFLGLARDMLMAGLFGTAWVFDAFTLAFRIPGLFRRLFGEGAMTAAFLPRFVKEDRLHGRPAASRLFAAVARRLILWLGLIIGLCECGLLAVWWRAGLSPRSALLAELTMIMLPYALLICIAALYCAALNGVGHFSVPALLPVALNVVWLAGGFLALQGRFRHPDQARFIAAAVLAGGCVQLLLSVRAGAAYGIRLRPAEPDRETHRQVNVLFYQMGPILFGLSITQVNVLVDSLLAWFLAQPSAPGGFIPDALRLTEGTASALYLGQRLFQFPMGVFGVALGTVLFPRFARHAAQNRRQELNEDIVHGLQLVVVIGLPAAAGLWLISRPATDLLFLRGAFDAEDAVLTARMIAAYGSGVAVFCGLLIVNRVFYAAGDQWTPARHGLAAMLINLVLDVALLPVLKELALPAGSVLAGLCQLLLALNALRHRFLTARFGRFLPVLWRSGLGVVLMTFACRLLHPLLPEESDLFHRALRTLGPVAVGGAVYWAALSVTGLSAARLLSEPFPPSASSSPSPPA